MLYKLKGQQIDKKDLKKFIGKELIYLFSKDIDYSGRGYIYPRKGILTEIYRKQIDFNHQQDFQPISSLIEVVEATPKNIRDNFHVTL
jgi:hypothetical protein